MIRKLKIILFFTHDHFGLDLADHDPEQNLFHRFVNYSSALVWYGKKVWDSFISIHQAQLKEQYQVLCKISAEDMEKK